MEQYKLGNVKNNRIPYTKIDDMPLNQSSNQLQNGGGIGKFIKKKYRKLDLASSFNKTKKKKILQHQRNNSSLADRKLYAYRALEKTLPEYTKIKADIKATKRNGASSKEITSLKEKKKALKKGIRKLAGLGPKGNINVDKLTKQTISGISKYEGQQKYYTETEKKIKADSVNYIQKQSEYKNVQSELKTKLSALATFDPDKIAIIRIPGEAPKAVNKLKYSDFDIAKPDVSNAYLKQFKDVNTSISKINSEFNIDHLSPERRIELARELHKITVDGIYDPEKQEKHFLKAVTDIAYKDKYYNALDAKSKGASFEYLKAQGSFTKVEDIPELNLKQQRDLLAKRLTYGTVSEHQEVRKRLTQLDAQLKLTPDIINAKRQVLEGQLKVLPVTNPKYQEIQDEIERLKLQADERIKTQKQMDDTDTELINKNITALTQKISGQNIDKNRDKLDELNERLSNPNIDERSRILLVKRKERITERIKYYEDTEYAISVYKELLPENRDKYMKYDVHELQKIYNALTQNKQDMYKLGDPQLPGIYESYLSNLKNMLDLKRSQYLIEKKGDLTPSKRTILLRQVGPNFREISTASDAIKNNRSINLLDAAQRTAEAKENAILAKQQGKRDIISARESEWKKGIMSGIKSKFVNSAAVKEAKSQKRAFNAEAKALNKSRKMYSEAMKKKLAPGQEIIKTKYGDIRFGNEAKKVSNLVNARRLQSEYAQQTPKNTTRENQLMLIQAALNKGKLSSAVAKKLIAERNVGTNTNVAAIISDIQTRKAKKRFNNLPKNKKIKMDKLFKAVNALPPKEQYDILSRYSNYYEEKYDNFGKLNISANKAKYAHIADKLAIKLNKLVGEHPELVPKVEPAAMPVSNKPAPGNREYTRIGIRRKGSEIKFVPPNYDLASPTPVVNPDAEPVNPVKYETASPGSNEEVVYANIGPGGQPPKSPYALSVSPEQPKGQRQPLLSATTLQRVRAELRPVKPNNKAKPANTSMSATLARKQAEIRRKEGLRAEAVNAFTGKRT